MIKKNKGFTLIELLVVIAIIGILATIVIVNLNSARDKARDSAIESALSNLRAAAEMEYDTAESYAAICSGGDLSTSGDFGRIKTNIESNQSSALTKTCNSSADHYCCEAGLNSGGEWCVDDTGYSGSIAVCDSSNYNCASD